VKRLFNLFLAVVMIFSFTCIQVYAANGTGGSGNIDGGGGSMGDATSHGSWNPGNEGVRVTVVRASDHAVVTTPFDLTNKTPSAGIYHFGKVSKIQYNNGTGLSPVQGGYSYKNPVQPMPRIISTNGRNNIEAIKKYFCSEYVVKFIAEETGMDYDTLISGEYKILLEPIAYYKFQGVMIATTATEAALYDEVVGGQLRYWMGSLTAKNLPLSMFLETPDLGYPAWSGPTNKNVSNSDIKSSLGLGIVRFEEQPEEPEISTYDYEYRTNTEVITAVEVSGGQSDPDDPVTVQFHIDGTTYTVSNVYYPDGDSQLAWVRWTTPDEPQDMTIDVDVSGPGSAQATIHCKIVDLDENPPPNPVADDRNDSFTPSPVPDRPEKTSAQWTIWDPWWQEYWVWHGDDEDGYWCDHGWWEFDLDRYSASLSAAMEITPDEKNPTASDSTMKSGYGVNQVVTARVNSSQRSATTALQNAVSYFPEFNYESFWRLLDRISISSSSSRLEFQKNEYNHRHYQYALAGLTPSEYYTYVTTGIYPVDNYYGIKATELMPIQALIAARRRAAEEKAKKYREASAKKRAMAQGKKKDPEFVIARDQRILRREIAKWTRSKELALQQISHLREILELSQKARAYLMTASADLILQLYNGENWGAHPELAYIYKMRELF